MAQAYIGLSGYSYKPWQGPGRFYPPTLKQAGFLGYYATRYDTVELDGVWYRLPSEKAVVGWLAATPPHFIFSPKVHRQISHRSRLKPEGYDFIRVMLGRLSALVSAKRLGPLLIQLPPNLVRNDDRLSAFLEQLPASVQWAIEFVMIPGMTRLSKRCSGGSMFPGSRRIRTSAQPNAGTRLIFGMCGCAEAPTMKGISRSGPARSERWSTRERAATSTASTRMKAHPGSGQTDCVNWQGMNGSISALPSSGKCHRAVMPVKNFRG